MRRPMVNTVTLAYFMVGPNIDGQNARELARVQCLMVSGPHAGGVKALHLNPATVETGLGSIVPCLHVEQ